MTSNILFVLTSVSKTLTGANTGWYLPEAAHPYYVLANAGYNIDFASPAGPNPPIDQDSVKNFKDDESVKFVSGDETVKSKLANAKKLSEVEAEDYDAIFYVGGHGPVIDLPTDLHNIALASEFYRSGKTTAAVCHGPAALVGVTDASGKSIFEGKAATGFSDVEEELAGKVKDVPFSLEQKIKEVGTYEKASEPWGVHVVVSGNLITGQNPASAKAVGEAILAALKAKKA